MDRRNSYEATSPLALKSLSFETLSYCFSRKWVLGMNRSGKNPCSIFFTEGFVRAVMFGHFGSFFAEQKKFQIHIAANMNKALSLIQLVQPARSTFDAYRLGGGSSTTTGRPTTIITDRSFGGTHHRATPSTIVSTGRSPARICGRG